MSRHDRLVSTNAYMPPPLPERLKIIENYGGCKVHLPVTRNLIKDEDISDILAPRYTVKCIACILLNAEETSFTTFDPPLRYAVALTKK